jgi:hypothetical protein
MPRIRKKIGLYTPKPILFKMLPKIMKTLSMQSFTICLKVQTWLQRPSRSKYLCILFYPIILFKKYLITSVVVTPDQKFTFAYWQSMKLFLIKIGCLPYGACRRNDYYFFAITCRNGKHIKTMDLTLSASSSTASA